MQEGSLAAAVVAGKSRLENELEDELQHSHAQVACVYVFLCEHSHPAFDDGQFANDLLSTYTNVQSYMYTEPSCYLFFDLSKSV